MLAAGGSSQGSPAWLTVVTGLAGVVSALAAVWFPLITGPRYRLRYGPMLPQQLGDGSWQVNIYLSTRGRRDITREAFDENKPVELNIGVPIRQVTNVVSSQEALRIVKHHKDGTCLLVGPGLIGRRQDLRFTVTTGNKPKGLTCHASLIDVQVRQVSATPADRQDRYIAVATSSYALGWAWVYAWLQDRGIPTVTIAAVIVGGVVLIILSAYLLNRNPLK